jgi:hypothetical protein
LLQKRLLIGVAPKFVIRLEFCGEPEGGEHFAALPGVDLAGKDAVEDHGESLLDGAGVAQRVKHVGAEARPRADGGGAGAAELCGPASGGSTKTTTEILRVAQNDEVKWQKALVARAGDWQRRPSVLVWRQRAYSERIMKDLSG